jgi:hypothetical protein
LAFSRGGNPATCCAILAESNDDMPFAPPTLEGVTTYEPDPKPLKVYVPAIGPGAAVVVETFTEPAPLITTFETNFGGEVALT